jgi:hypothetical protein
MLNFLNRTNITILHSLYRFSKKCFPARNLAGFESTKNEGALYHKLALQSDFL